MPLLNEKVAAETKLILSGMRDPVRLTCFTRPDCHVCGHVVDLSNEVAALAPALRLEVKDLVADAGEAARLGVARAPALALRRGGEDRVPLRYFGLPAGHEFGAFLRALLVLSTGRGAPGADAAAVAPITRPTDLTVFVLASCPRCAAMVYLCASIAAASPHVTVEVVDADVFPDLAARHHVGTVPLVVINGTTTVSDVVPAGELIAKIAAA
jgi:alkyl hydroperoxide reductase subunit AhpF